MISFFSLEERIKRIEYRGNLMMKIVRFFCWHQSNFYNFIKKIIMVLIIKKKESKKEIETLLEKREKSNSKGNLSKHFGKLKRNIDGLEYQLEIRKNED
jgi:hypothetical protein